MHIQVKVIPRSKQASVEEKDGIYVVRVTTVPVDNQANQAVIKLLAKYFKTAKSNLIIVKGIRSKNKVINILI